MARIWNSILSAEMLEQLKYGTLVNFVTDTSIKYFENCQTKFDFIFLDGDHSALTVYQEIPLAQLLNSNGIIYCMTTISVNPYSIVMLFPVPT